MLSNSQRPISLENTYVTCRYENTLFQDLETNFGVSLMWKPSGTIQVNVIESYKTNVCGLCGNYNDDANDDWMIGNSCDDEGDIVSKIISL